MEKRIIILISDAGKGLIFVVKNATSLVILQKFARTIGSLKLKLKWLINNRIRRSSYLQQLVFPPTTMVKVD